MDKATKIEKKIKNLISEIPPLMIIFSVIVSTPRRQYNKFHLMSYASPNFLFFLLFFFSFFLFFSFLMLNTYSSILLNI